MILFPARSTEVGGCNFCPTRPTLVTVVQSGMGLEVRLCDDCLDRVVEFQNRHKRRTA